MTGEFNWVKQIFAKNGLYLPRIGCRHFTHVIQLEHSDEEVKLFSSKLMEQDYNAEDLKPEEMKELKAIKTFSELERELIRREFEKPKNPDDPEPDEPIKSAYARDLTFRPTEDQQNYLEQALLEYNKNTLNLAKELFVHLNHREHLLIKASGYSCQELVQIILQKLGNQAFPLRPRANKLNGSDKELFTVEVEGQQPPKVPRQM